MTVTHSRVGPHWLIRIVPVLGDALKDADNPSKEAQDVMNRMSVVWGRVLIKLFKHSQIPLQCVLDFGDLRRVI